jgi:hypothetical protein
VLIVLFMVVGARNRSAGRIALIIAAIGGATWYTMAQVREAVPEAMTFLEIKADSYQSDLIDTRLMAITIEPLVAWARQAPAVWIVGGGSTDGGAQAHNLLISCLWMTGLLGTLLMIGYYAALFRTSLRMWRAERKIRLASAGLGPVFFALVLVMLLDDVLTNLRNHSGAVAYTFAVLAGGLSSAAAWSNCGRNRTALTGTRGMVTRAFRSGRATSHQQRGSHPQLNKCRVESAPL